MLAVADGIGGHRAGDIASQNAISCIEQEICAALEQDQAPLMALEAAMRKANRIVYELGTSEPELAGMGTTLTAALVSPGQLFVAHVGDTRLYLYRQGILRQLTDDHSLVGELLRKGQLSEEEARCHPQRNLLHRALGVEPTVEVDLLTRALQPEDLILISSDGLFSLLNRATIASYLSAETDLQSMAEKLVQTANSLGGYDNITVVMARWGNQ